ncbi:FecR domain-containing protein [Novosphingobium sp. SG707]|uniref:FecR family protein n=1 Tax=Novosphingobium sp. SG707 TaxID=2586996 RepID=UPI00144826A2|nr:FecR domain-containing protein [Novosphingobium sp. SG707]NKJ02699.1 transmembrane sensor [Novosphingobium sp. SG707]
MTLSEPQIETIDEAASDWMARLRAGGPDDATRQELAQWLEADSRHGERLAHYESLWLSLESVRGDPRILALREANSVPAYPRHRAMAAAAALVLMVGGVGAWLSGLWLHGTTAPTAVVSRLATGVGQVTRIPLQDGSTLVLDTDSAVETQFMPGQRRIRILRGQAFFRVAHDRSRPFIVFTDKMAVTATGTEFMVSLSSEKETVRMVEGSVIATPIDPQSAIRVPLTGRRSLEVAPGGRWTVNSSGNDRDLDWITGTLTFRNARLADIAAQMNRYSSRKITFSDPRLAENRLNAVLKAGDVDTFLTNVQDLNIAKVKSRKDNLVILESP